MTTKQEQEAYTNGFMAKCAEYGVNPEHLVKFAEKGLYDRISSERGRLLDSVADTPWQRLTTRQMGNIQAASDIGNNIIDPAVEDVNRYAGEEVKPLKWYESLLPWKAHAKTKEYRELAKNLDLDAATERRIHDPAVQKAMIWGMGNPEVYRRMYNKKYPDVLQPEGRTRKYSFPSLTFK